MEYLHGDTARPTKCSSSLAPARPDTAAAPVDSPPAALVVRCTCWPSTGELKMTIYDGLAAAHAHEHGGGRYGVLVDEQYGSDVARPAGRDGAMLAMSIGP